MLVCFAVKEEAAAFVKVADARPELKILLTGIGERNARQAIGTALSREKPALVLSCGFAGGLKPELATGSVIFAVEEQPALGAALIQAGATPGRFHCTKEVATTAAEKRELYKTTGADAVEMESQIIGGICREQQIPVAIVRVILDTANEDLPLDFNRLMTPDRKLDYKKLALALLRSPGKMMRLLKLQQQSKAAAEKLAEVLSKVTAKTA